MRIVMDMQGAQIESCFQNVCLHTLAFAKSVAKNRGFHEVILVLNGHFHESIEAIRASFDGFLSQENILVWYGPEPIPGESTDNHSWREIAELIREAFIAALKPDVIHIGFSFERHFDIAVTSIGRFEIETPVSVIFHNEEYSLDDTCSGNPKRLLTKKQMFIERASVAFSPDDSALDVISYWESQFSKKVAHELNDYINKKPRLAFVSPLPPQRTGIADYSAELIPALTAFYDIELVVEQRAVEDDWISQNCAIRDVAWLRANYDKVDRVLYHVGNSPYHAHIPLLLEEIPGTVVLHDFYLGHLFSYMEAHRSSNEWICSLYDSHGYQPLKTLSREEEKVKFDFPANWHILRRAQGVIVHSHYSLQLSEKWYGERKGKWAVIPLIRDAGIDIDRIHARELLGIGPQDFLVCTFGLLGETKLNHRLLDAWLESSLSNDASCHLVFVGENHLNKYGQTLRATIKRSNAKSSISITGWTEKEKYLNYLAAADIGVQLRTQSRGETSAAVLDCMNFGLATIVNANGGMADLDDRAVWKLPDEFADQQLVDALESLWRDAGIRMALGERAKSIILDHHAPSKCAKEYFSTIECFHKSPITSTSALIRAIVDQHDLSAEDDAYLLKIAEAISKSLPEKLPEKSLFVDVSVTSRGDLKTGIQRVTRALTIALMESPPKGYRIEPVYLIEAGGRWHYRSASKYALGLIDGPENILADEPVDPQCGDILLLLDLAGDMLIQAADSGLFINYRNRGVYCIATVYDLLPILMPKVFPPGADGNHCKWLERVCELDGAVCISQSVSNDLRAWCKRTGLTWEDRRPFTIDWFHLGADVSNSAPSYGLPNDADFLLELLQLRPTFLMVGTIEPRKGYLQVVDAFSRLWAESVDVNLVIVGKEGWKGWVADESRRNIPETVSRLRSHPELSTRLFWLEDASDEYLEKIYASSSCLIAASFDEGFGLPLIEAAQKALPIIARSIPVFQEVAGEHAFYFEDKDPEGLARSIQEWLGLYKKNRHPSSEDMPWLSWKESSQQLLDLIIPNKVSGIDTNREGS